MNVFEMRFDKVLWTSWSMIWQKASACRYDQVFERKL